MQIFRVKPKQRGYCQITPERNAMRTSLEANVTNWDLHRKENTRKGIRESKIKSCIFKVINWRSNLLKIEMDM